MATITSTEAQVRDFAQQFPTPNVLRAVELCESGRLTWGQVYDLCTKSLTKAARIMSACGCCGTETVPPYIGEDGYRYEGWYCEGCGAAWTTPTGPSQPNSCLLHRGH